MERQYLFVIASIIFIVMLGLFARYTPYDGKITHSIPLTVNAGDPNSRLSEAEYVLETGRVKYMPWWFTGEKDLLMTQPPLNLVLAAMMAGASGLEVFDSVYFNAVIAAIGVALCFFVLFSQVFKNKMLGLLAAALLIYPIEQFFHYQINIGMYANFSTVLFYPIILLFAYEFSKNPSWANAFLLSLGVALQFMMHSSEAVVFGAAIGSYLLLFERKAIGWKKLIGAGVIFAVLIAPYFPIFYSNFVLANIGGGEETTLFHGEEITAPAHEPQIYLTNVLNPLFYILALLAIIVTWRKKEYRFLSYIFLFYIFVIFLLAKFGIGTYYITIRTRPIFFAFAYPLVAIGLYTIAASLRRFVPVRKTVFMAGLVVLVIAAQAYSVSQVQPRSGFLFNEESYRGFQWLKQNTPENATIMCFGCQQFEGLTSHRVIAQPTYWEQITAEQMLALANKSKNTSLRLELSGYSDQRLAKKGLFGFEKRGLIGYHERDICTFDYFVFKPSQNFGQLYVQIGQNMIERNSSQAYGTDHFVVIKNSHKGGDCI